MAIEELSWMRTSTAPWRASRMGELMVRVLADAENLERMLEQGGAGEDAMEAILCA